MKFYFSTECQSSILHACFRIEDAKVVQKNEYFTKSSIN